MINFRIATKTDAAIIAALHAQSWQQHYHNVLSKEYLNGPILQERLEKPRAFLANKKHPQFKYSHKQRMQEFKRDSGVRLIIENKIKV